RRGYPGGQRGADRARRDRDDDQGAAAGDPIVTPLRRRVPRAPSGRGRRRPSQRFPMTVPCLAEPAPAGDLDAAVDELRAHGLRLSASRRLVLEALFAAGRPVTAEEIASGMYGRLPRCDLASVYRNLETLEELGPVPHPHLGTRPELSA